MSASSRADAILAGIAAGLATFVAVEFIGRGVLTVLTYQRGDPSTADSVAISWLVSQFLLVPVGCSLGVLGGVWLGSRIHEKRQVEIRRVRAAFGYPPERDAD